MILMKRASSSVKDFLRSQNDLMCGFCIVSVLMTEKLYVKVIYYIYLYMFVMLLFVLGGRILFGCVLIAARNI